MPTNSSCDLGSRPIATTETYPFNPNVSDPFPGDASGASPLHHAHSVGFMRGASCCLLSPLILLSLSCPGNTWSRPDSSPQNRKTLSSIGPARFTVTEVSTDLWIQTGSKSSGEYLRVIVIGPRLNAHSAAELCDYDCSSFDSICIVILTSRHHDGSKGTEEWTAPPRHNIDLRVMGLCSRNVPSFPHQASATVDIAQTYHSC